MNDSSVRTPPITVSDQEKVGPELRSPGVFGRLVCGAVTVRWRFLTIGSGGG